MRTTPPFYFVGSIYSDILEIARVMRCPFRSIKKRDDRSPLFLPIPSLPLLSGAQINGGLDQTPGRQGASPGAPRPAPEPLALEVGEDVAPQYDPIFVARLVGRVVD